MTGLLATPLWLEWAAVRGGVRGVPVWHTGAGRRAALPDTTDPVLVAGVAGGLAPQVRPGDVVVADEVRGAGRRVAVPSAPLLAGALRRLGLTVHVGPVVSSDRIVDGARRAEWAAGGALVVDLESATLAAAASGPVAVVRTVVDTARHPLRTPGTLWRGIRALRALRAAAPALRRWAAATGPREVTLAGPRSFCAGVVRAIDTVERALQRFGPPVYVRRQIVHNVHVVRDLTSRGVVFVDEVGEVPPGARLVLAAHGVSPDVRRDAAGRDLAVVDATCPLVTKVHNEVRRFAARGYTVFLIGHAGHEEVVGTRGEAPDQVVVVQNADAARRVRPRDPERVAYTMQTTLAQDEAEEIAAVLRERFPALVGPRRDDICYATTNRQHALRAVARDADLVLVIGSSNSSNSLRLVEVAEREGAAAYLVDDASEVDLRWLAGARRIGVTAGASAPPLLVDALVYALSGLGPVTLHDQPLRDEDVEFALPREVS